ncbi:MAG: flagellar basal body L-ring protein FlgH, partial [Alphaproteobacteria bacterium]
MRLSVSRSVCSRLRRHGVLTAAAVLLAGCNALDRLSSVGEAPSMSAVQNPTHQAGYRPVSMPMPTPMVAERTPNSLWRTGSRAFFKDLRANEVGDIVTVVIEIDDSAEVNNATTRTRTNSEDASMGAFLGYEQSLNRILPNEVNPANLMDLNSSLGTAGAGVIDREEKIEVKVAAVVTQLLPNG